MDGILNINKPEGITSFGVVAKVKRTTKEKRVGHAGTLDPLATGVLPVCLGKATRVIEYIHDGIKTYRAEIEMGISTTTYDREGEVTLRGNTSRIDRAGFETVLAQFSGEIQQTPPIYSALKHNGKPLYELARAHIEVELESRPVTIYKLEVVGWQPPIVTIKVSCSKGTYIRSLANDIGQALGCGAYMKSLVRLNYGIFDINDAISLPQLENAFNDGSWRQYLYPIDSVLSHLEQITLTDDEVSEVKYGRSLVLNNNSEKTGLSRARAYSRDGIFLAILDFKPEEGKWKPEKVFI